LNAARFLTFQNRDFNGWRFSDPSNFCSWFVIITTIQNAKCVLGAHRVDLMEFLYHGV